MPTTTRSQRRRQPVRSPQRRPTAQVARSAEPLDYTRDYADVRRDLILITIISVVLFAGMFALSFII